MHVPALFTAATALHGVQVEPYPRPPAAARVLPGLPAPEEVDRHIRAFIKSCDEKALASTRETIQALEAQNNPANADFLTTFRRHEGYLDEKMRRAPGMPKPSPDAGLLAAVGGLPDGVKASQPSAQRYEAALARTRAIRRDIESRNTTPWHAKFIELLKRQEEVIERSLARQARLEDQ